MTLAHSSVLKAGLPFKVALEEELVSYLVQPVTRAGICSDPISITNLYVSLKSKPLAVLAGPEQTGKSAMVQCLARVLMGGDRLQSQMKELDSTMKGGETDGRYSERSGLWNDDRSKDGCW